MSSKSPESAVNSVRWWSEAARALLRRPELWTTAVRQLFTLAPNKWWQQSPYLPLPDPSYFNFRLQTAYGDTETAPPTDGLITYLEWVKDWNATSD